MVEAVIEAKDAKVWFLAAGQKKVGPMATGRVLERVAQGKVPPEARVWRDGMDEWLPLHAVSEFQVEKTIVPEAAPAKVRDGASSDEGSGERRARRAPREQSGERKPSSSGERKRARAPLAATKASAAAQDTPFTPAYRIERRDLWRAFGLGVDRRRATILLVSLLAAGLAGGLVSVVGQVAGLIHPLLALPFVLASAVTSFAIASLGLGALSFHSRRQLEEAPAPGLGEAFGHALRHVGALTVPPVALSIAWVVPVVGLGLLALLLKIPYLGPVGTGLAFGAHIALGALTLYLLLTAGVASVFAPVVVGFEGTGVAGTFKRLLEFSRRSTARVLLWSILPGAAFVPFSLLVLSFAALSVALPLGALTAVAGREVYAWIATGMTTDAPLPGLLVGALPMAAWIGLTIAAAVAVLGSVANSLVSHLYAAGRAGNDERPTRDAVLAACAMKAGEN